MQWSSFSPSIAIHVLLPQFQTSEVALLSQVNRHWRALFKQESVWQALLMRDFPPSSESELPETVENATPEKRVNANDFRWTLVGARGRIPLQLQLLLPRRTSLSATVSDTRHSRCWLAATHPRLARKQPAATQARAREL